MKNFEERLALETTAWVREGLISAQQRDQLVARHPVTAGGSNRLLAMLAMIGSAMLLVGVSLIIKANWEHIGDWVKIGAVVALLVACHGAGWRLKMAPGTYPKTGDACFVAGAVVFLLGIALVSQIFHLDSRPANGVLLWWAGIALLPWLVRSKAMQVVSVAGWIIWVMMEVGSSDSWIRLHDGSSHHEENLTFGATGYLLGMALYFVGQGLRAGARQLFAGLHETVGVLVATGALYVMGFSWSTHASYRALGQVRMEAAGFLLGLVATSVGWALWRSRSPLSRVGWALALGLLPMCGVLFGGQLHGANWVWGGLACVAMFLLNLAMIQVGLATGRGSWINLGVFGIALNIVTRYFLLFGSMLNGGVFFVVTGLLLITVGYYLERRRRELLREVRKEVAS